MAADRGRCIDQYQFLNIYMMGVTLWADKVHIQLIADNGSVRNLYLPTDVMAIYRAVWDINVRIVLDMAADRGVRAAQSLFLRSCARCPGSWRSARR